MGHTKQSVHADQSICINTKGSVEHIEIKESITEIDCASWNRLCQPHQFCRHAYMTALEACGLECQYLYALAMSGNEMVGAALATTWKLRLPLKLSFRITTIGTPVNTGLPVMLDSIAVSNTGKLRHDLVMALERASVQHGVRLFVGRDFPRSEDLHPLLLLPLYNCAWLELTWTDFEQYLAQHPKRKNMRREMRLLEKAGYHFETRQGRALSTDEAQRLYDLWQQLYRKHASPDQIRVNQAFFLQMSRLEHAVWLLLHKDGRIDAFDMCFVLGDHLESTYCGVDLAVTGRLPIHRVMGYQIIRYAINQGLNRINLGISNEQEKTVMGCRLENNYAWMQANPRWLGRWLRRVLQRFVLPHDAHPPVSDRLTGDSQT